jgi:hypothetical protein
MLFKYLSGLGLDFRPCGVIKSLHDGKVDAEGFGDQDHISRKRSEKMHPIDPKTNTLIAKALAVFLMPGIGGNLTLTLDGGSCGQLGQFIGGTLVKDENCRVALCNALQVSTGKMVYVTPLQEGAALLMAAGDGVDGTWSVDVCVHSIDADEINAKYAAISGVVGRKCWTHRDERIGYMAVAMGALGRTVDNKQIELIDAEMEPII